MAARPGQRRIRWNKIKGPRTLIALLTATAMGAGLLPYAPGTFGSLVGLPIAYWIAPYGWGAKLALWTSLFAVGTWAAGVIDQKMGSSDNQSIVIDEVVGVGITAWTAGRNPSALIAAFVLFRAFDIIKPPPIRQLDRWSKLRSSTVWGGFGVMADDLLAGIEALAVVVILQHFGILP